MTKAFAVADLELRLTAGKPSDDATVWRGQLQAWIGQAADAQIRAAVGRDVDAIGELPGQAIKEYNCQAVTTEAGNEWCGPCPKHFVPMPSYTNELGETKRVTVPALPRNMGVSVWIGTQKIERAASRAEMLRYLDFGSDEFWYLLGDRVYIQGGHYPTKTKVSLHLLVTSIEALDDDDEIPAFDPQAVLDAAEQIGRRQGFGLPQDITNDGQAATASL